MQHKSVIVQSPATVANLVCGFDVLGMCINAPYDTMEVRMIDEEKIIIKATDGFDLPADPSKNTAGAPLLQMIAELNRGIGFEIKITKSIKPGSGLGSSAASAAGAAVAANHLLGNIFSKTDLVRFAMAGEEIASGVKHADNVAPCIFGGVTIIRNLFPLDVVSISAPELFVTVVHPQIEVKTSYARQILKEEVPLKDAVKQWANVAGLVAGLMQKDIPLIGRSLEDVIVEPARSALIPGFQEIKSRSMAAGAIGGGISGSGPSMFMLSENETTAYAVEKEIKSVYDKQAFEYFTYVTTLNSDGVKIIT